MDREAGRRAISRARRTVIGSAIGLTTAVTAYVWVSDTPATATTTATASTATGQDDWGPGSWSQGSVGPGGSGAPHAVSGGS